MAFSLQCTRMMVTGVKYMYNLCTYENCVHLVNVYTFFDIAANPYLLDDMCVQELQYRFGSKLSTLIYRYHCGHRDTKCIDYRDLNYECMRLFVEHAANHRTQTGDNQAWYSGFHLLDCDELLCILKIWNAHDTSRYNQLNLLCPLIKIDDFDDIIDLCTNELVLTATIQQNLLDKVETESAYLEAMNAKFKSSLYIQNRCGYVKRVKDIVTAAVPCFSE